MTVCVWSGGYDCFLDVEKLNAGNFRENIVSEMKKCDIFLLVLSKNALNRCVNPHDNVRQEIEEALANGLAIIPVMTEDFAWPETMPQGLESIADLNSVPYIQVYSEQFFERLYSFIETVRAERGSAPVAASAKPERKRAAAAPVESSVPARDKRGSRAPLAILGGVAALVVIALAILLPGRNKGSAPDTPAPAPQESAVPETTEPESAPAEAPMSEPAPSAEIDPGTNQLSAAAIPLNTRVTGTATDGKVWYYSFVTDEAGSYTVSAVNKSGEKYLRAALSSPDGTEIGCVYASGFGEAVFLDLSLSAQTAYTLALSCNGDPSGFYPKNTPIDFAVAVRTADGGEVPWGGSESGAPGTNQDEAAALPLNANVSGSTGGHFLYYSFRTSEDAGTMYQLSAVNGSDERNLCVVLCEETGREIDSLYAPATGQLASFVASLQPGTVYYLKVFCNGDPSGFYPKDTPLDYTLSLTAER